MGTKFRLHPSGEAVGCLLGVLAPPDNGTSGTVLTTSPITQRNFETSDYEYLEKFVRLQPWPDLVATMQSLGGTESDLNGLVKAGLILRLPGEVTDDSFDRVFDGLALVSLTGSAAVQPLGDLTVDLITPAFPETLPVPRIFYEVFRRSTGEVDWPRSIAAFHEGDIADRNALIGQTAALLRFLINGRLAAIINAR